MTSAYLAISFLKQTPLREKQLKILSYLPQEPLKEYLYNGNMSIKEKEICLNMI